MFKLRVCYADSNGRSGTGTGTGTGQKGKSPKRATRVGGGGSKKNATRVGIKKTSSRRASRV